MLLFHHDQESIQQIQIRLRLFDRKDHKRLIHIGDRRTDQFIPARQEFVDIALFVILV